ncbi:MAG TPA: DUF6624 domain-containing protein [Flavipsychrobacter sp.]
MRCLLCIIYSFLFTHIACAQNAGLKRQLDSIMQLDQLYRGMLIANMDAATVDSLAKANNTTPAQLEHLLMFRQANIDKQNLVFVEQVIKEHGYPGKALVGMPTNEVVFYVIQHSDKIATYFPMIKAAGAKGELPMPLVAMMEDRLLMEQNKPQLYGTQGCGVRMYDEAKDSIYHKVYIWPIKDAAQVEQRRKQAGFTTSLQSYAKDLGAIYDSKLTVEDIQKMRSITIRRDKKTTEFSPRAYADKIVVPAGEHEASTFRYLQLADSFSKLKDSVNTGRYLMMVSPCHLVFLGYTANNIQTRLAKYHLSAKDSEACIARFSSTKYSAVHDSFQRHYIIIQALRAQRDSAYKTRAKYRDAGYNTFIAQLQKRINDADTLQFAFLSKYVAKHGWPKLTDGGLYAGAIAARDIKHYYLYKEAMEKLYDAGEVTVTQWRRVGENAKYYHTYMLVDSVLRAHPIQFDISGMEEGQELPDELKTELSAAIVKNCPIQQVLLVYRTPARYIKAGVLSKKMFTAFNKLSSSVEGKCESWELKLANNHESYIGNYLPSDDDRTTLTLYIVK